MLNHNYGELYLRRMKASDTAESIIDAMALAAKGEICRMRRRKPPIVAVRHGFPGEVVAVGYTKQDVKARMFGGGRTWSDTTRFFRVPRSTQKSACSD